MPRRKTVRPPQRMAHARPALMMLAYLGFVSLGLPDGLLGIAWPAIRHTFQLSLHALGPLLVLFTLGYLMASFNSGHLLARLHVGHLLALSCLATAVSLLGYACTPSWPLMVVFGGLAGLGAGAIDAGLNTYVAMHYSARTLNWLHACYGIGATGGPGIMSAVLTAQLSWQWGYALVGLGQLGLAWAFASTRHQWGALPSSNPPAGAAKNHASSHLATLCLPATWLGMAAFFLYTGLEAAAGVWAYSLLTEARALPASSAGAWVSAYWGGLTVGRLLSGVLVSVLSVTLLLRLCMLGMATGAILLWLDWSSQLSCVGLLSIGVAAAPIFPSLIATTPARLGPAHAANGIGFQVASAVLGQSLLPSLMGVIAQGFGLEMLSPFLLTTALLLLVVYEALLLQTS